MAYESEKIRSTVGIVKRYNREKGFGFSSIVDEKEDAFLSFVNIEPEIEGRKKLLQGEFIEFDLHKNIEGFLAKNIKKITEDQYANRLEFIKESRFNR